MLYNMTSPDSDYIDFHIINWFLTKNWNVLSKIISDIKFIKEKEIVLNTIS